MSSIIWDRFETNAALHPQKAAFIYPQYRSWTTVTYAQLLDSSKRFVSGFQACGVTPGMRAALMTPPSADFFALALALLKLGIVPVIVDPAIGLKKVGECLKESKPEIFIGNAFTHLLRIIFGWGKDSVKYNFSIESVQNNSRSRIQDSGPVTPGSPAAILYTSGSTGLPKGAVYTQVNFAAQLDILADTFNISQDEIDLPAFPLYALIDVLLGVTSIIPDINFPVPGKTDPVKVLAAIQEFKVTNMFASPIVLDILSKYGIRTHIKLPSLKRVITAGAPAPVQLQENFRKILNDETDLFGIYGATEVLPIAKIESREVLSEAKHKSVKGAAVCLGRPVKGACVRIIQISEDAIEDWQDDLEVRPNVVGEITVKGRAVTGSYIGRPDATRLAKIKDGGETVHRMGDVGHFDNQGRLWYCGRKSQRVITNNGVLFTEQIEGIFNAHPLVYRTALVGVMNEPVLWVELEQHERNVKKEKLKQELLSLAADHPQASRIKTFLFMKRFPTDVRHNSKIIREKLTNLAEKRLT
jgi:olefin beta-lactone synthetase